MKLCRHFSCARLSLRFSFWLILLFSFSLSGCHTSSFVRSSSEKISGATASICSTLSQHTQMLRQSDSNLTLSQTIEYFAMDSLTGQVYLQSRTTINLSEQSSNTTVSEDSLKECLSAEVSIADSTRHISNVEVEASDTLTPSIASLLTEVAVVALLLAAACLIIMWYIKRK